MQVIHPPQTIKEWEATLETIQRLKANRFCDHSMMSSLLRKEARAKKNLNELKRIRNEKGH